MTDKPKILGTASVPIPEEEAKKFLHSAGIWSELSVEDRNAFIKRGEVLETRGGNKLAKLIGLRGAENHLSKKHSSHLTP